MIRRSVGPWKSRFNEQNNYHIDAELQSMFGSLCPIPNAKDGNTY